MKTLSQVNHLCVVVEDIETSMVHFEALGIGPWLKYPPLAPFSEITGLTATAQSHMVARYVDLGAFLLQLCQPGPEASPQREFLETRGEGLFYIGFGVPDADSAESALKTLGADVLVHGRRPDRGGFTIFDTADKTAGIHLQISRKPPVSPQ